MSIKCKPFKIPAHVFTCAEKSIINAIIDDNCNDIIEADYFINNAIQNIVSSSMSMTNQLSLWNANEEDIEKNN